MKNAAKDRLSGLWEWHFDALLTDSRARKNSNKLQTPALTICSRRLWINILQRIILCIIWLRPCYILWEIPSPLRTCLSKGGEMFHRISYGQNCSNSATRAWVNSKSVNIKQKIKLLKDISIFKLDIRCFACYSNISIFNKIYSPLDAPVVR